MLDKNGEYIYLFGSIPKAVSGAVGIARVPPTSATDLSAYEYWNGDQFQTERIFNPNGSIAAFNAGQGSAMWNPYYQKYLYFAASESPFHARCGGSR